MTPALAGTAVFAMALIVFRAWTQAITIDEATTYVLFVQNDQPFHWLGSTNNHVLNTALMRLTTRLFGVSEISARLPALFGTALYISACYRFCRRLDGGEWLRWAALVCFIYSPFVMDYLVAARGYSLALGFLMTAMVTERKTLSGCVLISTLIGLCFASNFAFTFACAAVMGGLFLLSWKEHAIARGKLIAAYSIPALLVVWIVCAPSIVNFPAGELTYGAHSLLESFTSMLDSQGRYATYVALPLAIAALTRPVLGWHAAVLGSTVTLHVVAYYALGLLYPLDRTGLFFVPLGLAVVALAAGSSVGWRRKALFGSLLLVAASNVVLLRLDHFEEWYFDADTDKIYSVLTCTHERHGVNKIASGWPYTSALNFYRQTEPIAKFDVVANEPVSTSDTEVFVVDTRWNPTVVADRKLTPIWKSTVTDAVIAVPQEQVARLQGSACF